MQKRIAFLTRPDSKLRHDARILMRQACRDQAKEGSAQYPNATISKTESALRCQRASGERRIGCSIDIAMISMALFKRAEEFFGCRRRHCAPLLYYRGKGPNARPSPSAMRLHRHRHWRRPVTNSRAMLSAPRACPERRSCVHDLARMPCRGVSGGGRHRWLQALRRRGTRWPRSAHPKKPILSLVS